MAGEQQWVMYRAVRWQVPFVSLDNKKYRVDIYQNGYIWEPEVLKGAATPFYTQEDDDEDAFLPIRTSSGYLSVIVENQSLVDEIIAHEEHDRYVELVDATDANNEVCVWNGFLAPDQYSGTWDRPPYELQLPLLSPLAACAGTRYTALQHQTQVGELIRYLFTSFVNCHPDYVYIAVLDNEETPTGVPFLKAVLTDYIFLPEVEDNDLEPIAGNPPLPPLNSSCSSPYQVLLALAKAFGYIVYETPTSLYFSAPDMTNVYRRVEWTDIVGGTSYEVVTLADHQFPTIAGNNHSRTLLPGKSLVRVFCQLEQLDELMELDLHKAEIEYKGDNPSGGSIPSRWGYVFPPAGTIGKFYAEYLRLNCAVCDSKQYVNNPPAGIGLDEQINAHYWNHYNGSREYVGGNWVNYISGKYARIPMEITSNEYALILTTTETSYTDNLYAGALYSQKKYSAINLGGYIALDFNLCMSDSWDPIYESTSGYPDDILDIPVVFKWGSYYYHEDGTWTTSFYMFQLRCYPKESDGKNLRPGGDFSDGYHILIPNNMQEELQGQMRLIFYTFPDGDIKTVKISDIKLVTQRHERNELVRVQEKYDYGLVDYRQLLSSDRLSDYKYEQVLTNHCINYSLSGIQSEVAPTSGIGHGGGVRSGGNESTPSICYEELLVSRLAAWYDRTIEELQIEVENEDIQPGARIIRGTDKYIAISRTKDWRNGQMLLTIQKMYDEQS